MSSTLVTNEPKTILTHLMPQLQDQSQSLQARIRVYNDTMGHLNQIYKTRDSGIEVLKTSIRTVYEAIQALHQEHTFILQQIEQLNHLNEGNYQEFASISAAIHAFYLKHRDEISLRGQYELAQLTIAEAERFVHFVRLKNQYQLSSANAIIFEQIQQIEFSSRHYRQQANEFYSSVIDSEIEALHASLLAQPMPTTFTIPNWQIERCEPSVQHKIANLHTLHSHWEHIKRIDSSMLDLDTRSEEIPAVLHALSIEPFNQIKSRWIERESHKSSLNEAHRVILELIEQLNHLNEGNYQEFASISTTIHAFYQEHRDEISLRGQYALAQATIAEAQRFVQFVTLKNQYLSNPSHAIFTEIQQIEFSSRHYRQQANEFYSSVIDSEIEALHASLLAQPMPTTFAIPHCQIIRCEPSVQRKIANLRTLQSHWERIKRIDSSLLDLDARSEEIPAVLRALSIEPFNQIKSRWRKLEFYKPYLSSRHRQFNLGLNFGIPQDIEKSYQTAIAQLGIATWSERLNKIKTTQQIFTIIMHHRPQNYDVIQLERDLCPLLRDYYQSSDLVQLLTSLQTLLQKKHIIQPFSAQCIDAIKTCFNRLIDLITGGHRPHFFFTQKQALQQVVQTWITSLNALLPAPALPH